MFEDFAHQTKFFFRDEVIRALFALSSIDLAYCLDRFAVVAWTWYCDGLDIDNHSRGTREAVPGLLH